MHHYVAEGLLPAPVKTGRTSADYDPACVERIRIIRRLQERHRCSLREVRTLLDDAERTGGLQKLRHRLATAAVGEAWLRASDPVPIDGLCERVGLTREQLRRFEEEGFLRLRGDEVSAADAAVVEALVGLDQAGFDHEHGFRLADARIYVDAMRDLLERELAVFLDRANHDEPDAALIRRAEEGLTRVTPLLLALRRKLIEELGGER